MHEDIYLEKGRELLNSNRPAEALKEIKKALKTNPDSPEAHLLHGKAYFRLAVNENSDAFFLMAEESVRTALKLDPRNFSYHNELITIMAKSCSLSRLTKEYRIQLENTSDDIYNKLLERISVVSLSLIPVPGRLQKKKKSIFKTACKYFFLMFAATVLIFTFYYPKFAGLRIPSFAILASYIVYSLYSKSKSTGKGRW